MSSPDLLSLPQLKQWQVRAMASVITIHSPDRSPAFDQAVRQALRVFRTVEAHCTRFDSGSALMKANAAPDRWHRVPRELFEAVREAYSAHLATEGAFDPRVLDDLVSLGYDRSFTEGIGPVTLAEDDQPRQTIPWWPRFFRPLRLIHTDGRRIDLGGIGKGLAVRWAADILRPAGTDFLIEAGGDCFASGRPEPQTRWRIGVEAPAGGSEPLAVLEVRDAAVATSSTRLRRWRHGDRQLHHLIDPRAGRPGGEGLQSVTVIHADAAQSEVWSKTAFLTGCHGVRDFAESHELPALWVDESERVGVSSAMRPHVVWEKPCEA